MKILHIVPWYKPAYVYGGPIESVSKLCESTALRGHQVDVYTTTANGSTELNITPGTPLNIDGVRVTYFKRITKDPTNASPALWQELKKTAVDYDAIHIHSWWNPLAIVSTYIALKRNSNVILSPRGMLTPYILNSGNRVAKMLIHQLGGRYLLPRTYFHATAEAEYQECKNLIPNWEGFVAPNILSLPDLEINKQPNEVFTMIYMSRLHPKKGLEMLFEALSEFKEPFLLKIAGSGEPEYVDQLKALAKKLNIDQNIIWLGWLGREQKFDELANADLFVLVSQNENFANVVIEALHMGTPALLSSDVALSSFVQNNDLGWVTTLKVSSVRQKLIEAKSDTEKRANINSEARKIISATFDESAVVQLYLTAYNRK